MNVKPRGYVGTREAARILGYKQYNYLYVLMRKPWFGAMVRIKKIGQNIFFNLKDIEGIKK